MLSAGKLNPTARPQRFLAEECYRQQRQDGHAVKPMGIFQKQLVVEEADREHQRQAGQDPIDLFDMGAREFCAVGGRVNLAHSEGTDQQHKGQQDPVKVAEGDHPLHQFTAAELTTWAWDALAALGRGILLAVIFTNSVPPCRCSSSATVSWSSLSPGAVQTPAIGTEPGSALSLNSMGLLRSWRC